MMTSVNISRCVRATRTLLAACLLLVAGGPASGAQSPGLPAAADSMAAWHAIEPWIRDWTVPAQPASLDPEGSTGAAVTLRLGGRILGRSSRMGDDGLCVWNAVRDAWLEADGNLPFENDALRAGLARDAARAVTIDLELAGTLTPILGESESAIVATISPGYHGVAGRLGASLVGVFPGVMLTAGAPPAEGVRIAAGRLGLPPLAMGELVTKRGLTLYRFPTRHLAQTGPGAEPEFLYRGGRIVPLGDVTLARLRRAADECADQLIARRWKGPEAHGLLGDYDPVLDSYEPSIAPPLAQGLAAFALAKYASIEGAPAVRTRRAAEMARLLLSDLTRVTAEEADPLASALDAAAWLVAADALATVSPDAAGALPVDFAAGARERVNACFENGAWTSDAPDSGRGLLALAMAVSALREGSTPEERSNAREAVRRLFRDTERARLVGELPWLGWAELALVEPGEPVPAAAALSEVRDLAQAFRVKEADAGPEFADMVGGVLFARSTTPLPTAQTLRPLAFLATMLADERLTPRDRRGAETGELLPSYRFVLQLIPGAEESAMYRDPTRSEGGVRRAAWDQHQPVEATAMGLVCLSELLRAFPPAESPNEGR